MLYDKPGRLPFEPYVSSTTQIQRDLLSLLILIVDLVELRAILETIL